MNKPLIKIIYYESINFCVKSIINKKSPIKHFAIFNSYLIKSKDFVKYENNIKINILKL